MNTPVLYDVSDSVAHVTLHRPEAGNAVDLALATELNDALEVCEADPTVRAVLLDAAGSSFCVGGDLKTFDAQADDLPRYLRRLTTVLHASVSRLVRMHVPVVTAVQGSAAGAGFSLACVGDLLIAATSARFVVAYTRVGLVPDGGSTYVLPRLVGARRARELALTNRVLTAEEALAWGVANRVVADTALSAEAQDLAARLAAGPTQAFRATKALLQSSHTETLESQMELEARAIVAAAATIDGKEGIRAFLEKRAPAFTGGSGACE